MSTEFDEEDPLINRNRAADLERIKQARKKRISQLKSWQQYDKMMEKNKARVSKPVKSKFLSRNVHFPQCLVLLDAAGRGDLDEVNQILLDGASPDVCNEDGLTALHQCCIDNNLAICRLLLQYGVNINATDSEMWTPLHAAAACAHIDICACLIENGAELLVLNAEGNMPYDICEEENTLDLIENAMATRGISQDDIDERRKVPELKMLHDLQKKNVDLTKLDEQGVNYLHIASSCGYLDVGRFLLDKGVAVDILDKDGWQPIHIAACWGQLEMIELCLLHGADINSTTMAGETIYEICEDAEMNQRLLQMKEEIERQHEIKKTQEGKVSVPMLNRRTNSGKRRSSSPDDNAAPQGHLVVGSLRRTASIRRSSMREKSLMSWKEARQEALIREAVQQQISTDAINESSLISGHNRLAVGDQMKATANEEIDISQVLLNIQIVTENEMAQKEPLVRRGSSRNSFTHAHPYHSPSRDPSLLEDSLNEESLSRTKDSQRQHINSQRNGKNLFVAPSQPEILSPTTKKSPPPINSSFIRNCDPNLSAKSSNRVSTGDSKPKREIDNRVINKSPKSQGCCAVM